MTGGRAGVGIGGAWKEVWPEPSPLESFPSPIWGTSANKLLKLNLLLETQQPPTVDCISRKKAFLDFQKVAWGDRQDKVKMYPWHFIKDTSENDQLHLQRLVYLGGILAAVTFASQLGQPAPYGRHDKKDRNWGPPVHQRIGHVLNDGLWGVVFFSFMYFKFYGWNGNILNLVFSMAWLTHFIHRGFIHPFVMRYSSPSIALGIPVTGLTLAYFSYAHATFLAQVKYDHSYLTDLRFCVGSVIFVTGFCINRWADWTLRNLRTSSGIQKYSIPKGGLFEIISSPNYFGEMVEWLGWAIATWSPIGAVYFCFASATFIPRARHNRQWYAQQFKNYPKERNAVLPFVY